jgi:hypothetical protein
MTRTKVFKVLCIKSLSITVVNGTKCSNTNPNYLTSLCYITVVNVALKMTLYAPETNSVTDRHIAATVTLFLFGRKQSEFLLGPETRCPAGGI